MSTINKWDNLPEETKKQCLDELMARLDETYDQPAGVIIAQDLMDIMTDKLGSEIYNMALEDSKKLIKQKLEDIEFDIDGLRQS